LISCEIISAHVTVLSSDRRAISSSARRYHIFAMAFARLLAAVLLVAQTSADGLLNQLQRAIGRNDRQAVAALIQYPIIVTTAGVRISIRDAASLVESYDAVFTPELEAAIRNGRRSATSSFTSRRCRASSRSRVFPHRLHPAPTPLRHPHRRRGAAHDV
jgi:hypothetical protein